MNEEIAAKVNDIINYLENNKEFLRFKELKNIMKKDKDIVLLMRAFEEQKEIFYENNMASEKLIESKKALYEHPIISEYRELEAKLNYFILYFNNKFSSLTDSKACKNPTSSRI